MRWTVRFVAVLVLTAPAPAAAFDAPLKTETHATSPTSTLHCLTFPNFLLKWENAGPITPVIYILPGKGPWKCAATMKGELNFGAWPLVQVKGRYIVLQYQPNATYGSSFRVFDTMRWRYGPTDTAIGDFAMVRLDGGALVLRFRRPVNRDCSLYYGAATECWGRFKRDGGLTDDLFPDCRASYEVAKKKLDVADITGYPATVTYNAQLRIAGGKAVFAALPGPITCEP